jgi:predicted branched-subunit amino acid permease
MSAALPEAPELAASDNLFAPDYDSFDLTNGCYLFIIVNMRSLWRTTVLARPRDTALLRDVGLVCLADGIVGVSFGATSVAGGLAWWVPLALSVLVFAGGSQIAAVGVVLAGGSPLAAVAAGAVLNTRLFPYGLAVADVVKADAGRTYGDAGVGGAAENGEAGQTAGRGGAGRWARLLRLVAGAHLITDESVAFTLRQADQARRHAAFWACGATLFVVWNVAVLAGLLLGSTVRDTNTFGLDATFPAVLLALALPTLTSRQVRVAAGAGAVIAVALTPLLPAGLPVLAALGGLGARWGGWGKWRRHWPRHTRPDRGPSSRESDDDAVTRGEVPSGGGR